MGQDGLLFFFIVVVKVGMLRLRDKLGVLHWRWLGQVLVSCTFGKTVERCPVSD